MGRVFVLIGCLVAALLIIDSARNDPDVHPAWMSVRGSIGDGLENVLGFVNRASAEPTSECNRLDETWAETRMQLPLQGLAVGQILFTDPNQLAAYIVVTRIDARGGATRLDLVASQNVTGVFSRTVAAVRFRTIDPPAQSVERITGPGSAAIAELGICHSGQDAEPLASPAFPFPTATVMPTATATATPVSTAASTATYTPTATSTSTPVPTASYTEIATATASATTTHTATKVPTETRTATTVPTASSTATATFTSTVTHTSTPQPTSTSSATTTATATPISTSTAQPTASRTSTAEPTRTITPEPTGTATPSETASAVATASMTATRTATPAPTSSATSIPTTSMTATAMSTPTVTVTASAVPLLDTSNGDFTAWTVPNGWTSNGELTTDGTNDSRGWVVAPISISGTNDYSVTFTFVLSDSQTCPRSFGVAVRGSESGYLAGGLRWDCDASAVIWASQDVLTTADVSLEPGEHTFGLRVVADKVTLSIDETVIVETTTDRYPSGSLIGFWSDGVPVTITNVRVEPVEVSGD